MTAASPVFQVWNHDGSTGLSVLEAVGDWAISDVFCDVGSMTLTVFPQVDGEPVAGVADLLVDEDRQIRVIQQDAPDMWFLVDDDAWAGVSDAPDSEPRSLACRSLAGVLDEVHVMTEAGFTSQTPGHIISVFFTEASGRGFLQGVTLSGGATLDAGGLAWADTVTVTYRAGTSLLAVLKGLSEARLVEWRLNGRTLEIHRPGGGLNRTLTDMFLRPGADVASAPVQRSRKPIATHALVVFEGGGSLVRSQALPGRRHREAVVPLPAGADEYAVGDIYLGAHGTADVQLSHDLQDGDDTPRPWRDFRPGDQLPTVAAGGGVTFWRVAQVAMGSQGNRVTVSVELGSLIQSAEERFADTLARLDPGARVLTS